VNEFPNLVAMHRATADRLGPRTALRYRRDGLYRDVSWDAYRNQADAVAAGLIALGIATGDRVGILAENRHEWLVADIGILTAGAVDVPLHSLLTVTQCAYQLEHSGAKGLFVSNQAQFDKIASIRRDLPGLEWVISFDATVSDASSPVPSWRGLLHRGRQALADAGRRAEMHRRGESRSGDDLATIIYTSGTTGRPKGVMLSHGNLVSNARASATCSRTTEDEILLSWLPYSHIYARTCDHYVTILAGATLCLAESADTLLINLVEIEPTDFTSVPRFYEKLWTFVESLPPTERAGRLRRIFGPRCRRLSSGGAPLPIHVAQGFVEAGLPLLEGYGLTESSPVISFNTHESCKVGSVGRPVDGVEVRIDDDGEILTRGPHVMKGYWADADSTREAIVDGWLRTGDVGTLDDEGFLTITDRKKDLIITSGGKNIAPSELELLLVSDPYIDQAIVYGDRRPFVTALIVPNLELLDKVACELGCPLQKDHQLIRSEAVHRFMADRVSHLMEAVSRPERVKAFLLLGRPLRADAEELTATQKVRRRHMLSKFASDLDALYVSTGPEQMGPDADA